MAFFRKIKAGLVKSNFEDYIGEEGQLFFNVETGVFGLGDGTTPGGQAIFAFLQLPDTPSSYLGAAGKFIAVNATEDSLEFVDAASGFSRHGNVKRNKVRSKHSLELRRGFGRAGAHREQASNCVFVYWAPRRGLERPDPVGRN